jgi:hypothetical protein
MMSDSWYELVDGSVSITQGDIIFDCPVLIWNHAEIQQIASRGEEKLKEAVTAIRTDVIVMTQACDLEHNKVANVSLCPHLPLDEYKQRWEIEMREKGQNPTEKAWKRLCDDICDGFLWNLAMLNKCTIEGTHIDYRIVDFHEIFTSPRNYVELLIRSRNRTRFRLLPPYREHLSQAFARFFMRVGLPTPIESVW